MTEDKPRWGIVRYAPGSGLFCDDDAAAFDGWYSDKAAAEVVYLDWVKRYRQWIVAIVRTERVHWGNGDFTAMRKTPLTAREIAFRM